MSIFEKILEFESGGLSDVEVVVLFQTLVDSGDIWKLPSEYTSTAAALLARGILKNDPRRVN